MKASGDVALGGKHGQHIDELLTDALADGQKKLAALTRRALARFNSNAEAVNHLNTFGLFNSADVAELADSFAETIAVADLLGRSRIHERMTDVENKINTFAESQPVAEPFRFEGAIQPLPPTAALDYFSQLVPMLGVNPQTFAPQIRQYAFTLAASTSQTLTARVQDIITSNLANGLGTRAGAIAIEQTLDAAGVLPSNPQYSEMVYRTNALSAYNRGAADELQTPIVQEFFPCWQYIGIDDGRERERHREWFGKYFPNSITFEQVRDYLKGSFDGFNCRCTFRPVSRFEWARLEAAGAVLSTLETPF